MEDVKYVTMGKGNNDILAITEEALENKVMGAISQAAIQTGGPYFEKGGAPDLIYTDTTAGELLLNQ